MPAILVAILVEGIIGPYCNRDSSEILVKSRKYEVL